jgi:hypothetical protein
MNESIELEGASFNVHLLLIVILGLPLLVTYMVAGKHTLVLTIVGVTSALIFVGVMFTITSPKIKKEDNQIVVTSGFYSQKIPINSIISEHIEIVDLDENKEYAPGLRTNGIGLIVLNIGYYHLQNGDKAFVVQRSKTAVYVPTKGERNLLLSSAQPEKLLEQIKEML